MGHRGLVFAAAVGAALVGQGAGIARAAEDSTVVQGLNVTAQRVYPVQGLVITAHRCAKAHKPADAGAPTPKLVSTFPPRGSVVRPGLLILRLTFDAPMTCDGLLDSHEGLLDPCPAPLNDPVISTDRRTFLAVCRLKKSSHYGMWLNRSLWRPFTSVAGRQVEPAEIVFDTSDGPDVTDVKEALAQDKVLAAATKASEAAAAAP